MSTWKGTSLVDISKQVNKKHSVTYTLPSLRSLVMIDPNKYRDNSGFKKYVILPFAADLHILDSNISHKIKTGPSGQLTGVEFFLLNPPPKKQYNRKKSKPNMFSKIRDNLSDIQDRFNDNNGYIAKIDALGSILDDISQSINSINLNDLLEMAENLTCEAKPDIMEEKRQALEDCLTALESIDYNPEDLNEPEDSVNNYCETMFDPLKAAMQKNVRLHKKIITTTPSTTLPIELVDFDETRFEDVDGIRVYLDLPEFKEFEDEYDKDRRNPNASYKELARVFVEKLRIEDALKPYIDRALHQKEKSDYFKNRKCDACSELGYEALNNNPMPIIDELGKQIDRLKNLDLTGLFGDIIDVTHSIIDIVDERIDDLTKRNLSNSDFTDRITDMADAFDAQIEDSTIIEEFFGESDSDGTLPNLINELEELHSILDEIMPWIINGKHETLDDYHIK